MLIKAAVALGVSRIWRRNDNTELQNPTRRGDGEGQTDMIWFLIGMKCGVDEIGHLSETRDQITALEVGDREGRISTGGAHRHGEMKGGGRITAVIIAKKNIGSVIRSVGNHQLTLGLPCVICGISTSGIGFVSHSYRPKGVLDDQ